jgi:hypothetical protein
MWKETEVEQLWEDKTDKEASLLDDSHGSGNEGRRKKITNP